MDNQTIAWLIYLAGCLGFGLVCWRITRRWPRYWRHLILVTYCVFALTPYSLVLEPPASAYAPAFFIAVLNTVFQGWETALEAAVVLALVWIAALVVSLIYLLLTGRHRPATPAPETVEDTAV